MIHLLAAQQHWDSIVAIHGLDGHREKTWTAANDTLWLRDLLPADLPNARVLSYGYDADTRSNECVSTNTIYRHAEKFMQELSRKRKGAPRVSFDFLIRGFISIAFSDRSYSWPIAWVASFSNRCGTSKETRPSTYPLQALVISHAQTLESKRHLRDILVSTHGVLFFGTPHSGTNGAALLQTMNRLLSVYMQTTDTVLQHLKTNCSELENLQRMYHPASEKLNTVCFYEEYPTPIIGGRKEMARTLGPERLDI